MGYLRGKKTQTDSLTRYTKKYIMNRAVFNSITGPRAKQCTGAQIYTTTYRNKTGNVDRVKHKFIVLVLPTKSVFKH